MADLDVRQTDLDAARTRLASAAASVDDVCLAVEAVGSPIVAGALGDVDALVRGALGALSTAATTASTDVSGVGTVLDDADSAIAEGVR